MRRLLVYGFYAFGISLLLTTIATKSGLRINTTGSYPRGIYWMTDAPIEKGKLVIFCPPDTPTFKDARERGYIGAGFCPGGYGYMIKKLSAVEGDIVGFSANGVFVNGNILPNSLPEKQDSNRRKLPDLDMKIVLTKSDVLLMSDYSPRSFDGRYFGLINKANIISVIRPVWTW